MDIDEALPSIIEAIASGSSVRRACATRGTSDVQFFRRMSGSGDAAAQLRSDYTRARSHRADARFESIDSVGDEMRAGEIDAQQARVLIDAIKWQCAHEMPARYGDRVSQEISGPGGGPVQSRHEIVFVDVPKQLKAVENAD